MDREEVVNEADGDARLTVRLANQSGNFGRTFGRGGITFGVEDGGLEFAEKLEGLGRGTEVLLVLLAPPVVDLCRDKMISLPLKRRVRFSASKSKEWASNSSNVFSFRRIHSP